MNAASFCGANMALPTPHSLPPLLSVPQHNYFVTGNSNIISPRLTGEIRTHTLPLVLNKCKALRPVNLFALFSVLIPKLHHRLDLRSKRIMRKHQTPQSSLHKPWKADFYLIFFHPSTPVFNQLRCNEFFHLFYSHLFSGKD